MNLLSFLTSADTKSFSTAEVMQASEAPAPQSSMQPQCVCLFVSLYHLPDGDTDQPSGKPVVAGAGGGETQQWSGEIAAAVELVLAFGLQAQLSSPWLHVRLPQG